MNTMKSLNCAAYTGLQRLLGSHVGARYREFLRLERGELALRTLTEPRLDALLSNARSAVPFYRERVNRTCPSLSDYPILTKRDLRERFIDIMQPHIAAAYRAAKPRGYSWLEVKTGGSTGVPTNVIHGKAVRDGGRAARMYSQYLCGFPFGTPYWRLWGSMREISQMKESWTVRMVRVLARERLLNAFRMGEQVMTAYLDRINAEPPRHMMAYVDCAVQLARFAQNRSIRLRPLNSIMACAGTLTAAARTSLTEVFGARVHNKYGSRECCDMACECDRGKLHIYANSVLLEVVDVHGRPVPPGNLGRILVTLLDSSEFPIIRYEIGDMGTLASGLCECGRPFPLLEAVEGRSTEFFITSAGGFVSPVYLAHLIGVVHNSGHIRRFQMVQHSLTRYTLRLERNSSALNRPPQALVDRILADLRAVLGVDCVISVNWEDRIPETGSGKFLHTISEVTRTGVAGSHIAASHPE